MKLTVAEIVEMIDNKELIFDMSTQRGFIYNDMVTRLDDGTPISKAGAVINSILERGIQLPAVYFWHNTETGKTHIHDGKQRILSIYYFIKQHPFAITTKVNGKEFCNANSLGPTLKKKLLNYTLDIVENTGGSEDEENSFYIINTSGVNLTDYEALYGMLYGEYLNGFESAVNNLSNKYDFVTPIGRGEQAIHILYAINGIGEPLTGCSNDTAMCKLKAFVRKFRNAKFDPDEYRLEEVLSFYNSLAKKVKNINIARALWVAVYVVENNFNAEKIIQLYDNVLSGDNDVKKWNIDSHKTFINMYISKGKILDGRRFFSDDVKNLLYSRNMFCSHINENGTRCSENRYNHLVVDHIIPWAKGGRTTIENGQLMCGDHNESKGGK